MRPTAIGFDSEWRPDDGVHLSRTALLQVGMSNRLRLQEPFLPLQKMSMLLMTDAVRPARSLH